MLALFLVTPSSSLLRLPSSSLVLVLVNADMSASIEAPVVIKEEENTKEATQDSQISPPRNETAWIQMETSEKQCIDYDLIEEVKTHPCIYDVSHPHNRETYLKENAWREIAMNLNVGTEYCKLRWKSIRDRFVKTEKESRQMRARGLRRASRPYRFASQLAFLKHFMRARTNSRELKAHVPAVQDGSGDEDVTYCNNLLELRNDQAEVGSVEDPGWTVSTVSVPSPASSSQQQSSGRDHPPQAQDLGNDRVINYLGLEQGHNSSGPGVSNSPAMRSSALDYSSTSVDDGDVHYDEVMHFLVSLAPSLRRLSHQKQSLARIKIQTVLHELEFS